MTDETIISVPFPNFYKCDLAGLNSFRLQIDANLC